MTRFVLLDNIAHKDLRVRTGYSAEFGDNVNNVLIFPTEFAFAQREYPILFRRDTDGNLQAIALLGLDKDENLFLDDNGWNARYVPAVQQRGPFLIGFRNPEVDGDVVREPVIHVDLDHPRISQTEGEPVFLRHGGNSPYLERCQPHAADHLQGYRRRRAHVRSLRRGGTDRSRADLRSSSTTGRNTHCRDFSPSRRSGWPQLDGVQLERLHKSGLPATRDARDDVPR